eukprot:TRINITY_DN40670_c0_g1_i1.p1 TRINITY_DN40670_c0_g1~~TRINITY_DN40670_c0_g1_i1.p1  ORF type:complete len:427 (-),score=134.64 TRINITY_DN40670_c0_g1_i1:10-1290(-)
MAKAAVDALSFSDDKKAYILNELDPVLEVMVRDVLKSMPPKPMDFMVDWLRAKLGVAEGEKARLLSTSAMNEDLKLQIARLEASVDEMQGSAAKEAAPGEQSSSAAEKEPDVASSEEEEEDDDVDEAPPPPPPAKHGRHRASVSAESTGMFNQKKAFDPPKHPKTEEQTARLREILTRSFLFSTLDDKNLDVVLLAMEETTFEPGERIIQEGDDGDFLCLIEEGSPECKKVIDGEMKVVKTCQRGDVFGELALLYNAQRAASVDATDRCVAWKLDRETFNHIVKGAAMKQTALHEEVLRKVQLFDGLDERMRSQISDALSIEKVVKDDTVIKQDEEGDKFYIVEEGSLIATIAKSGAEPVEVATYGPGDYFGELAMLKDQPRAASVKVVSDTAKVLWMDRGGFTRLLGPLQDLMNERARDAYGSSQ